MEVWGVPKKTSAAPSTLPIVRTSRISRSATSRALVTTAPRFLGIRASARPVRRSIRLIASRLKGPLFVPRAPCLTLIAPKHSPTAVTAVEKKRFSVAHIITPQPQSHAQISDDFVWMSQPTGPLANPSQFRSPKSQNRCVKPMNFRVPKQMVFIALIFAVFALSHCVEGDECSGGPAYCDGNALHVCNYYERDERWHLEITECVVCREANPGQGLGCAITQEDNLGCTPSISGQCDGQSYVACANGLPISTDICTSEEICEQRGCQPDVEPTVSNEKLTCYDVCTPPTEHVLLWSFEPAPFTARSTTVGSQLIRMARR